MARLGILHDDGRKAGLGASAADLLGEHVRLPDLIVAPCRQQDVSADLLDGNWLRPGR